MLKHRSTIKIPYLYAMINSVFIRMFVVVFFCNFTVLKQQGKFKTNNRKDLISVKKEKAA